MAEFELNTALLTNMEVLECLSRRGGTAVYSVKSTRSEQLYILKHISVPESQKQVEALIFSGAAADNAAAQEGTDGAGCDRAVSETEADGNPRGNLANERIFEGGFDKRHGEHSGRRTETDGKKDFVPDSSRKRRVFPAVQSAAGQLPRHRREGHPARCGGRCPRKSRCVRRV